MAVFQNKFFSKAGQKERLKNVVSVIKTPFSGGRNVANTKSKLLNKALEAVANNPIKTALVGGTVANIPKAVSVVKAAKAAKAAKTATKAMPGIIKEKSSGGLLDLDSLGRSASKTPVSPSGGLIKPQSQTGGTVSSIPTSSYRTTSPKRRSTRRARKSKRTSPRKRARRSTRRSRSRTKKHYGTAKQYARKGGKSVKYTKNGQPYIILSNGRARFIKGKRR